MPTVTQNEVNLLKQKEKLQEKINELEAKQGRLSQAERGKLKELAVQMDALDVSLTSVTSKFDMAITNLANLAKGSDTAKMAFDKLGASKTDEYLERIASQTNKSASSIGAMADELKTLNAQGKGTSDVARAIESSLAIESDILGIYSDKSKLLTSNLIALEAEAELTYQKLLNEKGANDIATQKAQQDIQRVRNLQSQQSRAKTLNDVESKGAEIQKKVAEFAGNFASSQGRALLISTALVKVLQFAAKETAAVQATTGGTIGNSAALATSFRANLGITQNLLGAFTGVNGNIRDAALQAGIMADNMDVANNMAIGISDATLAMQTGLSSTQVAELAQMMSEVTDVSREGASAQLVTVQALAQANKVAPSKVFASMAQNASVLATMTDGSAESMGKLAVQAAKAGVELSSLESIADSLLNIETSIAAEFEAEVLLGRQLNLDAARRFALNNDNEGLIREIQKNLQGTNFSDLNRLQRQSLAGALGVNVADLGRLISRSGNQNVVDVADQQLKGITELNAQGTLTNDLLGQILKGIVALIGVNAVGGFKGLGKIFGNASGGAIPGIGGVGGQSSLMRRLMGDSAKGGRLMKGLRGAGRFGGPLAIGSSLLDTGMNFATMDAGDAALKSLDSNKFALAGAGIGAMFGGLGAVPGFAVGAGVDFLANMLGANFYANGGPVTESGVAMVGERGPELVALGRGSHVVPNHYLGGYQGGATNMKISDPDTHRALMTIASHLESINTNTANTTKGVNNIGIATGA